MKLFCLIYCRHAGNLVFLENVHGDEIFVVKNRSRWRCSDCWKHVYRPSLFSGDCGDVRSARELNARDAFVFSHGETEDSLMIGGTVTDVLICRGEHAGRVYVNVRDDSNGDSCGLYLVSTEVSRNIRPGDRLWWQSDFAYYTPRGNSKNEDAIPGIDVDVPIERIGFSGVTKPENVA